MGADADRTEMEEGEGGEGEGRETETTVKRSVDESPTSDPYSGSDDVEEAE